MVMPLVAILLWVGVVILLVPCAMLFLEAFAAVSFPAQQWPSPLGHPGSIAVIVPAHNEETVLRKTLEGLQSQLRPQDNILVVADNCTDNTAQVAQSVGATVIERSDALRRGKGYALAYGLQSLQTSPPDIVVFMDADCDLQPHGLLALADYAQSTGRPVQANYLIEQSAQGSLKSKVSAFAIKVKNFVRPLGLTRLGAPCLLTGTGIALPWSVATAVNVASGHIAEDMKWGLDLAVAGYPPTFLPGVQVTSRLPSDDQAAKTQRTRWEHGHLQIMKEYLPRLGGQSLRQGRGDLLALGLEISILPLSLLVMVWGGLAGASLLFALVSQGWWPFFGALITGIFLFGAVLLAWAKFGQGDISLRQLLTIPLYVLWKIPLYLAFLVRPEKQWIRTERDE